MKKLFCKRTYIFILVSYCMIIMTGCGVPDTANANNTQVKEASVQTTKTASNNEFQLTAISNSDKTALDETVLDILYQNTVTDNNNQTIVTPIASNESSKDTVANINDQSIVITPIVSSEPSKDTLADSSNQTATTPIASNESSKDTVADNSNQTVTTPIASSESSKDTVADNSNQTVTTPIASSESSKDTVADNSNQTAITPITSNEQSENTIINNNNETQNSSETTDLQETNLEDLINEYNTLVAQQPQITIKCPYCNGSSYTSEICKNCDGTGKTLIPETKFYSICSECFGYGNIKCTNCLYGDCINPDYNEQLNLWHNCLAELLRKMGYSDNEITEMLYNNCPAYSDTQNGNDCNAQNNYNSGYNHHSNSHHSKGHSSKGCHSSQNNNKYQNNYYSNLYKQLCVHCYGKGSCYVCNGTCHIRNNHTGNIDNCTYCVDGICSYCNGTGYQE